MLKGFRSALAQKNNAMLDFSRIKHLWCCFTKMQINLTHCSTKIKTWRNVHDYKKRYVSAIIQKTTFYSFYATLIEFLLVSFSNGRGCSFMPVAKVLFELWNGQCMQELKLASEFNARSLIPRTFAFNERKQLVYLN